MFAADLSFKSPMDGETCHFWGGSPGRPGALLASALDSDALKRHIEAVEDQDWALNAKPWFVSGDV